MNFLNEKRSIYYSSVFFTILIFYASAGHARNVNVSGMASLSQSYDSNVFSTHNDHISEWITEIAPVFHVISPGSNNNIQLSYAPNFEYNHRRDSFLVTQGLTLAADKQVSSKWRLTFNDIYSYSDNPVRETINTGSRAMRFLRTGESAQEEIVRLLFPELAWPVDDMLYVQVLFQSRYDSAPANVQGEVDTLLAASGNGNRRERYWSNSVAVGSVYEFARGSSFNIGYTHDYSDTRTDTQADSHRHSPYANIIWEINAQWTLEAGYILTSAEYDNATTSDSDTHDLNMGFIHRRDAANTITGSYALSVLQYDGDGTDQKDHTVLAGWEHAIDAHTRLNMNVEGTYLNRENAFDERGGTISADLSKVIDRASLSFAGSLEMMHANLSGDWGRYLREEDVSIGCGYTLSPKLTTNADVSYNKRTVWAGGFHNTYDTIEFGAGISYVLLEWLTMNVTYDYALLDTDSNALDDYFSHNVMVSFNASEELWRW